MKNPLKFFIWLMFFVILNCVNHILLTSIITFFHLQLDHRLVDIQDWVNVNNWNLYFIRVAISFYCFDKLISVFYYKKSTLLSLKDEFLVDIDIKKLTTICFSIIAALTITFIPQRNGELSQLSYSLLESYLGHSFFLSIMSLVFLMIAGRIRLDRFSRYILAILYVITLYLIDTYFLKQMLVHQAGSFSLLFLAIYLAALKKDSSFKMSFLIIVFALAPFISFCGLDLMHGDKYAPFTLKSEFTAFSGFSLSIIVGLVLWFLEGKKKPADSYD